MAESTVLFEEALDKQMQALYDFLGQLTDVVGLSPAAALDVMDKMDVFLATFAIDTVHLLIDGGLTPDEIREVLHAMLTRVLAVHPATNNSLGLAD